MQGFARGDGSDQLSEADKPDFILHDDAFRLWGEIAEAFNACKALQGC
jgi:hypothetical protein